MFNLNSDFNNIVAGRVSESATTVCFDKVSILTKQHFDPSQIIGRARKANRGDGYIIHLPGGHVKQEVYFHECGDGYRFSFNLSYSNFWTSLNGIEQLLGGIGLKAKVLDIEIAITMPVSFSSLTIGMDYGPRRAVGYVKHNETFYIGKLGNRHEVRMYNKTREMKVKAKKGEWVPSLECTRLELLLKPNPEITFEQIPQLQFDEPFSKASLVPYNISFIKPSFGATAKQWEDFYKFKGMCSAIGFWRTRRDLNKETKNNFNRNFGRFYELEEWPITLDEIYQRGIRGYFEH